MTSNKKSIFCLSNDVVQAKDVQSKAIQRVAVLTGIIFYAGILCAAYSSYSMDKIAKLNWINIQIVCIYIYSIYNYYSQNHVAKETAGLHIGCTSVQSRESGRSKRVVW